MLAQGSFDRIVGSLHCLPDGDALAEPSTLYPHGPASDVFRTYLEEIPRMVADVTAFDPYDFEDELRQALRSVADADRVLEINTEVPLDDTILTWWCADGGAHTPRRSRTGGRDLALGLTGTPFPITG